MKDIKTMDNIDTIFNNTNKHLLEDESPSLYFETLYSQSLLQMPPFTMIADLKNTLQSPKHHPEGNVWNHTMLVLDEAAKVKEKSSDVEAFMWAALLHDIGKPGTTRKRNGKITSYDHDKLGSKMVYEFFKFFDADKNFMNTVAALVRWHMQILYVVNDLPYRDITNMKKQVNINDVALLSLCDRLGRTNANIEKEEKNIEIFLIKCNKTL